MSLPPKFQKLKELEAKATPGPWIPTGYVGDLFEGTIVVYRGPKGNVVSDSLEDRPKENHRFIAAARNQAPALLEALEIAMVRLEIIASLSNGDQISMQENGTMGAFLARQRAETQYALKQIEKLGSEKK
jgi:hypothetical protein